MPVSDPFRSLSFDEFRQAQGKSAWVEEKRKADSEHPLFEALHQELIQQYRTFLMVGGMPASVVAWLETQDYSQCQAELDEGTTSEVDYVMAHQMKVLPLECKAGTSGKMKSLRLFMRNKHITHAVRCSLENFSQLVYQDEKDSRESKYIRICPLYAVSNVVNPWLQEAWKM